MHKVALIAALALVLSPGQSAGAQMSLSTAVDLAERNSPKVKMAEADLARARASLGVSKDAFIPTVAATGGYGKSTGAPLGVPVIFALNAQSLIYNFSQFDYIRAAGLGIQATEHALAEARIEVAEDATNTYLALDNALRRRKALQQAGDITGRLVTVVQDRLDAGVDPRMELTKTQITGAQIRLQNLALKDEIAADTQHLASLTGTGATTITTDPRSIPPFAPLPDGDAGPQPSAVSEGIAAAYAVARSKQQTARGDRRYLYLPQVSLQANFSRVDTGLSSYLAYYPAFDGGFNNRPFNSQNSLGFGAAITIPILDYAHRSHAKESAADAAHAFADARQQEGVFLEGRARLQNSALELDARADLAHLNQQLAQDQLDAIRVQMEPGAGVAGGIQVNPKDELNAELQERLRFVEYLNAELQLQQTRVNLLRQQGQLNNFVHQSITGTPTTAPTTPSVAPIVPGVPPAGVPPVIPASGVTGGSVPNSITAPNPAAPQTPPHP